MKVHLVGIHTANDFCFANSKFSGPQKSGTQLESLPHFRSPSVEKMYWVFLEERHADLPSRASSRSLKVPKLLILIGGP